MVDTKPIPVKVVYYAILRDQRGIDSEVINTSAGTAYALFDKIKADHPFTLDQKHMRVAVNDKLVDWQTELASGDEIVFLPPVAGG